MITEDKITEIYCLAADFCDYFSQVLKKHQLPSPRTTRKYHRAPKLSDAEVITILVLFHLMGYRCLKHFLHRARLQAYYCSELIRFKMVYTILDHIQAVFNHFLVYVLDNESI